MRRTLLSLIAISSMIAGPALAQEAAEGRPPSHCIAFVENTPRLRGDPGRGNRRGAGS